MPDQEPAPDRPAATSTQRKTAAKLCLAALSLLVIFLVAVVIAAIRQPPALGPAMGWEAESSHVWDLLAWMVENLGSWAVKLASLAALATLLIGVFTDLFKSTRKLPILIYLLGAAFVLTVAAYFMTTRWSEVTGAILYSMSAPPCPPCKDCPPLTENPAAQLACAADLLNAFWIALLVWLSASIGTGLGLKHPKIANAVEKVRKFLKDRIS